MGCTFCATGQAGFDRQLTTGEITSTLDAPPWTAADAPYRLPVTGQLITGFGAVSAAGIRSRGLTLDRADDAVVTAPAAGTVAYARAFRDYGPIVILAPGTSEERRVGEEGVCTC